MPTPTRRLRAGVLVTLLLAGACGRSPTGPHRVRGEVVTRLDQPVAMAVGLGGRLLVAERTGRVVALDGEARPTVWDLTADLSLGAEQGLLGIAASPDRRRLYADLTARSGDVRVVEGTFAGSAIDPASVRTVLVIRHPRYTNHNGGALVFGPDGLLYVGTGDGGGAADPRRNAQSLSSLLGKILRIDPHPSAGRGYTVPPDNPFVGRLDARPEIWAYGLRNPWRFSFDRVTGDLWLADVGEWSWEEIDHRPAASRGGENYGWSRVEGRHRFHGAPAAGDVAPVLEYPHRGGACAVTGGYVYRGRAMPWLRGVYVFADFCAGQVMGLRSPGGGAAVASPLGVRVANLASFGEDDAGELYALSLSGEVLRLLPA